MSMFKSGFIMMVLTCASFNALAEEGSSGPGGLLIEPGVTYEIGSTTVDYPSTLANSTGSSNGLGVMARAGVHLADIVFVGLDGRYAKTTYKDSAFNSEALATSTNWGPVVGVQMPIVGLRAWASYILGGTLDPEKANNVDVKFSGAGGYRLGAGFHLLLVSLNLEYQSLKYNSATLEQAGPFASGTTFDNVKLSNSSVILSVTFPLAL